jgi:hypothetical protein
MHHKPRFVIDDPPKPKLTAWEMTLCVAQGVALGLYDFFCEKGDFVAGLLEESMAPRVVEWKLKTPILPIPAARRVKPTVEEPKPEAPPPEEKQDSMVRGAEKALVQAILPAARPWKFKDKVKPEDLLDPGKVLVEKANGVGTEAEVDKEGRFTSIVSMRGAKVNMLSNLPALAKATLPESVRDAKLYMEITHPKGNEFVSGLLHSKPEKAAAVIQEHGHPTVNVLAVHKLGGHDTSHLKYDEMRGLVELVAQKIPHGRVPEHCEGNVQEKTEFKERIRKECQGKDPMRCDGVLYVPKDAPNKGMTIQREKWPMAGRFVVMGFKDSDKIKDGVASLEIGDGARKLGKVNVADPRMRSTIKLNPNRYMGKVVQIVFTRQTKTGSLIDPRLTQFLFADNPDEVPKWDPEKKFEERLAGMEPDPKKRESLKYKLKTAAGWK